MAFEISVCFNNINGLSQRERLRLASVLNIEHLVHNHVDQVRYVWLNY